MSKHTLTKQATPSTSFTDHGITSKVHHEPRQLYTNPPPREGSRRMRASARVLSASPEGLSV